MSRFWTSDRTPEPLSKEDREVFRLAMKTIAGEIARAVVSADRIGTSSNAPGAVFVGDRFFVLHKAYVDGDGVVWIYEESTYLRLGIEAVDGEWRHR